MTRTSPQDPRTRTLGVAVLFILLMTLVPGSSPARVGGGNDYVGGGGGGGSFGGGLLDGNGDGAVVGVIGNLVFTHPKVGVPLGILLLIAYVYLRRRNPSRVTIRAITGLEKEVSGPGDRLRTVAGIQQRDPDFDAAAFLARTRRAAEELQEAWLKEKLEPIRRFVSDSVYNRFRVQLEMLKVRNLKNVMADYRYQDLSVTAFDPGTSFETVHVKVKGEARDVEVPRDLDEKRALSKAKAAPLAGYEEIWSFMRRTGARTLKGRTAIEGGCPNCGAELDLSQVTRCAHCKALVNSGEHDWVLAEITQIEEWRPGSSGQAVPGLAEIESRDPGLSRQELEDRGSYAFWKWIEARILGKASVLLRTATPELVADLSRELEDLKSQGRGSMIYRPAVGSVDLAACDPGDQGGREKCYLKVRWSAAFREGSKPSNASHVLCLSRPFGAKGKHGLSWARCPECGGPLAETDATRCAYCSADLTAGAGDWVLESVDLPESVRIPEGPTRTQGQTEAMDALDRFLVPDMGDRRERVLLLSRMAAVVVADGVVTREERKLVQSFAKRWQIPMEAVEPILNREVPFDQAITVLPSNKTGFFSALVQAALVDGRIDREERRLLSRVAKDLGMSAAEVDQMMSSMEAALKASR